MPTIFKWAIRQQSTGYYMPSAKGRHGTGGTELEPGPTKTPRLFDTERAAKIALNYWLQGKAVTDEAGVSGFARVRGRNPNDRAVVPVRVEMP